MDIHFNDTRAANAPAATLFEVLTDYENYPSFNSALINVRKIFFFEIGRSHGLYGNFFLVGVINLIRVPQVPVVAFKLSLFNRWTAGVGQFVEISRLIAPDQTTVLRKGEVKFGLQDAALHATNVTLFAQVEIKTAGTYYVEVLVDDVMKLRYPVPVIVTPPPNQPPSTSAPPATRTPTA